MEQRNHSVTIAKALAIILMVVGHSGSPDCLSFLSLIRMPVFFVMSGYCFKAKYLTDARTFLKRRITGIYWPFVKWMLFFTLMHNAFFGLGLYDDTFSFRGWAPLHQYELAETIERSIKIVFGMNGYECLCNGYWFLKTLFWGSIIFYILKRTRINDYVLLALLVAFATVAPYFGFRIPWFDIMERDFLAAAFILTGNVYRESGLKFEERRWLIAPLLAIVVTTSFFLKTDMQSLWCTRVIPYYLVALCGTMMVFTIAHWLNSANGKIRDFLVFTGGNTFNVLTWHFLSFRLVSLVLIVVLGLPWDRLAHYPVIADEGVRWWAWPLYTIIGVALPVGLRWCFASLKTRR